MNLIKEETFSVDLILNKALDQKRISLEEGLVLFKSAPLLDLGEVAQALRNRRYPKDEVTFIIDRNINYTNTCTAGCRFCAFAFQPKDQRTYVLSYEEIYQKTQELAETGGTQILLQGGHNPELGLDYYRTLFSNLKRDFPQITLHALSPSELDHLANVENLSIERVIEELQKVGWNSMPGGGAEILVERVRQILSPLKISSERWLEVSEKVHQAGIGSSATMMFGHVETFRERLEHLEKLRTLQDKTNGFRAFICWSFQKGETPLSRDKNLQKTYQRGSGIDYLRTQAIARIFLNIPSMQASWVTEGFELGGQSAISGFGVNDFGGTMLEENVVSAAGAIHSKSNLAELVYQINKAGFKAIQRDTFYRRLGERKARLK